MSLFGGDMSVYVENPRESTKPNQSSRSSASVTRLKGIGYKMPCAVRYVSREQFEV